MKSNPDLDVILLTVNGSLCIKTVWKASAQFVKIFLKYGFQWHIQCGSGLRKIPCYVSKFLY